VTNSRQHPRRAKAVSSSQHAKLAVACEEDALAVLAPGKTEPLIGSERNASLFGDLDCLDEFLLAHLGYFEVAIAPSRDQVLEVRVHSCIPNGTFVCALSFKRKTKIRFGAVARM